MLGAVIPLTGRYAAIGAQVRIAYELAVEDVNANGGVDMNGVRRPLALRVLDDESDPQKTVQHLETLNSVDHVAIYLGGAGSDLHAAGAAIGDKNRIPYVGVGFALYEIHQRGLKYLFSPFVKSPALAEATIELMNSLPQAERPARIAIFHERTDWGIEMARDWTQLGTRNDYEVVVDEEYAVGRKDFSDIILKAKAARADAAFATPNPPDGIAIIKQMKELDFSPKMIMFYRGADAVQWAENLGKDGDYVITAPGWHYTSSYPGAAELNRKHQTRYGRQADSVVGPGYAMVQIIADALRRAGSIDGAATRDALAQTDLMTVMGPVKFNPDGTGIVEVLFPQWQNGKQELVWPREQATASFAYPAPPFAQR